jgi:hypothetical protein
VDALASDYHTVFYLHWPVFSLNCACLNGFHVNGLSCSQRAVSSAWSETSAVFDSCGSG